MKNLKFDITPGKESNSANIDIEGDLSLKNAAALKIKFAEVSATYDEVAMHVANVSSLDLSVIQLFLSIRKSFEAAGKDIQIDFSLSEEIGNILKRGGFQNLLAADKK